MEKVWQVLGHRFFWEFGALIPKKIYVQVLAKKMTSSPAPGQKTAFFGQIWHFFAVSVISMKCMKVTNVTTKKQKDAIEDYSCSA